MSVTLLRVSPSGPAALYDGKPVEIGTGFATRSDLDWRQGPRIVVGSPSTDLVLYGTSPADPIVVELAEPKPYLAYEFEFMFFFEHTGTASFAGVVQVSLNNGGLWVNVAATQTTYFLNASGTIVQTSGRLLGSALGVTDATPSMRARLFLSDNDTAYDIGYVRSGRVMELLP
jgi:hypothetical protein